MLINPNDACSVIDDDTLELYVMGRLAHGQISQHLASCDGCRKRANACRLWIEELKQNLQVWHQTDQSAKGMQPVAAPPEAPGERRRAVVIIEEDNPADAKLLRSALARRDPSIDVSVLSDGARAINYFSSMGCLESLPCDLILLDLNLPYVSGFEVLKFLKSNAKLRRIPVVILSGSSSEDDISLCYASGADTYRTKPNQLNDIFQMTAQLVTEWIQGANPQNEYASQ